MTLEPDELVGTHWPLDGPYGPQRLAEAFEMASELVRYANHATRYPEALPSAPEAGPALGALASTVRGLPQLAGQLAGWARGLADDPSLQHDQYRRDHARAAEAAEEAAVYLRAACGLAERLYDAVGAADQRISHLYHWEEPA